MKRFEFVTTLLLNIVTCGIYSIYMWYAMAENNNAMASANGRPRIQNFIIAYLLGCVTCGIYLIYWYYKFAEQQIEVAKIYGQKPAPTDNAIVMMILYFVPIYSFYVICDNYNRTVDAYNGR